MKTNLLAIAVAFFSLQFSAFMFFENLSLKREIRISEKSKEIANDQINDLMYTISNLRGEKDFVATQQFVAGVVEATQNKDHFSQIWHDGYDRGSNVAEYARQVEIQAKNDSK